MGQGFYRQSNISYSQASQVVSDHIQSRQDIETSSSSEDDIAEPTICQAQIHITEIGQSDSSENDQMRNQSISREDNIITL